MLAYSVSSLGYPGYLSKERAFAIIHDGDKKQKIMSSEEVTMSTQFLTLQTGQSLLMDAQGSRYKHFVVHIDASKDDIPHYDENDGIKQVPFDTEGTYWAGTISASGYGSDVVVKRWQVNVVNAPYPLSLIHI